MVCSIPAPRLSDWQALGKHLVSGGCFVKNAFPFRMEKIIKTSQPYPNIFLFKNLCSQLYLFFIFLD